MRYLPARRARRVTRGRAHRGAPAQHRAQLDFKRVGYDADNAVAAIDHACADGQALVVTVPFREGTPEYAQLDAAISALLHLRTMLKEPLPPLPSQGAATLARRASPPLTEQREAEPFAHRRDGSAPGLSTGSDRSPPGQRAAQLLNDIFPDQKAQTTLLIS